MKIVIETHGTPADPLFREWIDRRLQLSLSRFGSCIRKVTVIRADNDPVRSGTLCQIRVSLTDGSEFLAEDLDPDPERSISVLADRSARTVARHVELHDQRHNLARGMVQGLSGSG